MFNRSSENVTGTSKNRARAGGPSNMMRGSNAICARSAQNSTRFSRISTRSHDAKQVTMRGRAPFRQCSHRRSMILIVRGGLNQSPGLISVDLCSNFQAGAVGQVPGANFGRKPAKNRGKLKYIF